MEKIAPKVLKAGADVLVKAQKEELGRLTKGDRSTGELQRSIHASKVRKSKEGNMSITIAPRGMRKHGNTARGKRDKLSNAQVGYLVEYDTSKQPARPWMSVANKKAENAVIEAMQKAFSEEIGKL